MIQAKVLLACSTPACAMGMQASGAATSANSSSTGGFAYVLNHSTLDMLLAAVSLSLSSPKKLNTLPSPTPVPTRAL